MAKTAKTLPMKAIVGGLVLLFVALVSIFLLLPAFFDVHLTDALFEKPPPAWQLPAELQAKLEITEAEMVGLYEFQQYCGSCHGDYGHGGGPQAARIGGVPNLLDPRVALKNGLTDEGALKTINEGVPGTAMPSFQHISDRVKQSLLAYLSYARRNQDRLIKMEAELHR